MAWLLLVAWLTAIGSFFHVVALRALPGVGVVQSLDWRRRKGWQFKQHCQLNGWTLYHILRNAITPLGECVPSDKCGAILPCWAGKTRAPW